VSAVDGFRTAAFRWGWCRRSPARSQPHLVLKAHLPPHPTRLYFIRHGEVDLRYRRIFTGSRIDMELSPLGHEHGRAVADWFGDSPLDAVYLSPMQRVLQTAAPLLERQNLQPVVLTDLREVDFGDWTGHRWEQIQERFGMDAFDWLRTLDEAAIPNGESAEQLLARVRPCLQRILDESSHRSVAVVCHGGIIRVMLALLLEVPLAHTAHYNIDYGSVTLLERQPEKKHAVEIELLNFCPLLDRYGVRLIAAERV
jgi:broad specificity phosphatase PhoE